MLADYMEKDLIRVMPHSIKGGIDTICAIARLFNINLTAEPWPGPIVMVIKPLTSEERVVLSDVLSEYRKEPS